MLPPRASTENTSRSENAGQSSTSGTDKPRNSSPITAASVALITAPIRRRKKRPRRERTKQSNLWWMTPRQCSKNVEMPRLPTFRSHRHKRHRTYASDDLWVRENPRDIPAYGCWNQLDRMLFFATKTETDGETMKPLSNRDRTKKRSSCLTDEKTMFSLKNGTEEFKTIKNWCFYWKEKKCQPTHQNGAKTLLQN